MYENTIAIEQDKSAVYPCISDTVFPDEQYLELPFTYERLAKSNHPFRLLRKCFIKMGFDKENIGTVNWNPLGRLINCGNTVLIKPNLVLDENATGCGTECLYTQASTVAAVIPYVIKALGGSGRIIIGDAPMQECDFSKLIQESGYQEVINYYSSHGINICLCDLRGLKTKVISGIHRQEKSCAEGILVSLGNDSEHANLDTKMISRERVTNYDPNELYKHHNEEKHEYLIAKEALLADVIIDMPKPKSHRLAGATISMKNFVGIATRKEYLPHHRIGDKHNNGDEYNKQSILLSMNSYLLDLKNRLMHEKKYTLSKAVLWLSKGASWTDRNIGTREKNRVGAWYGNDTIWRTILDLNKIVLYADKNGKMRDRKQRKLLIVADMIIVGEHEGPCYPEPKAAGIIAVGVNTATFDEAIATIMGFDIKKMPLFRNLRNGNKYKLIDDLYAEILSNNYEWNGKSCYSIHKEHTLMIKPTDGWKGYIELE